MTVRLAACVGASAVVLLCLGSAVAAPPVGTNGPIYISYLGLTAGTGVVGPDGTVLDASTEAGYAQTFDPSGTMTTFVHGSSILFGAGDGRETALLETASDGLLNPSQPSLSRDGSRIAYAAADRAGDMHIAFASIDGGVAKQLTSGVYDADPKWSPTADTILFTRYSRDRTARLALVDASGAVQPLFSNDASRWEASWAPDGQRVVFVESGNGGSHIASMRLDGSEHRQLVGDDLNGQRVDAPVFSPDGRKIAFINGSHGVFVVDVDGSNLHAIAYDARVMGSISWRNVRPAIRVSTQDVLDNVVLSRQSIPLTFHVRATGGAAVPGTSVTVSGSNVALVSGAVDGCPLRFTGSCSVTLAADGEVDATVIVRPLHAGTMRITLSAASSAATDSTSDDLATLTTVVSRCTMIGSLGADRLRASRQGGDYICGDRGNDTIDARNGRRDDVDGGAGVDTAMIDRVDRVIRVEHVQRSK